MVGAGLGGHRATRAREVSVRQCLSRRRPAGLSGDSLPHPGPGSLYVSDARIDTPPVTFHRDEDQNILLPGQWWQELLAGATRIQDADPETIADIARATPTGELVEAVVPRGEMLGPSADDTLLVALPVSPGRPPIVQELLLPGTEAYVPFPREWIDKMRGGL